MERFTIVGYTLNTERRVDQSGSKQSSLEAVKLWSRKRMVVTWTKIAVVEMEKWTDSASIGHQLLYSLSAPHSVPTWYADCRSRHRLKC